VKVVVGVYVLTEVPLAAYNTNYACFSLNVKHGSCILYSIHVEI